MPEASAQKSGHHQATNTPGLESADSAAPNMLFGRDEELAQHPESDQKRQQHAGDGLSAPPEAQDSPSGQERQTAQSGLAEQDAHHAAATVSVSHQEPAEDPEAPPRYGLEVC